MYLFKRQSHLRDSVTFLRLGLDISSEQSIHDTQTLLKQHSRNCISYIGLNTFRLTMVIVSAINEVGTKSDFASLVYFG